MDRSKTSRARRAAALWVAALGWFAAPLAAQQLSGPDVWAANCAACHRLRTVDAFTASQWNTIATHMGLVARLTPPQTAAVREFLVGSARARQAAMLTRELLPAAAPFGGARSEGGANALEQAPAQAATLVAGPDIYRANCVACHGPQGRGNGAAAAAMNPRPTDFTDASKRQAVTDAALDEVIQHGRRGMPAFGRTLRRAQLDSVIAYMKTFHR